MKCACGYEPLNAELVNSHIKTCEINDKSFLELVKANPKWFTRFSRSNIEDYKKTNNEWQRIRLSKNVLNE